MEYFIAIKKVLCYYVIKVVWKRTILIENIQFSKKVVWKRIHKERNMEKEKPKFDVCTQEKLKKSNFLISAMYKATPLEIKVTYLAMFNIQQLGDYKKEADGIYTTISAAMILEQMENSISKNNKSNLYKQLSKMARSMTSRTIGINNDAEECFEYITLINRIVYSRGKLTIRFPLEMEEYLLNQKENFTLIPKKTVMSFKKSYSIKLYEILRRICFYNKYYEGEKNYIFRIQKDLAELKFNMGIINANDEKIKSMMLSSSHPDYTLAAKRASEKMYNTWREFKREIIDVAVHEINENTYSNIRVKYTTIRSGHGGKTTGVIFTVMALEDERGNSLQRSLQDINNFLEQGSANNSIKEISPISQQTPVEAEEYISTHESKTDEEKMLIVAEMTIYMQEEFADCVFSAKDVLAIVKAAEYNVSRVKKAVKSAKESTKKISNIVGWLITCIKDGGYSQNEFSGNNSRENRFNDYPQRKYSKEQMDMLEKQLLAKSRQE